MKNLSLKLLRLATGGMLSMSIAALWVMCLSGGYQPEVPQHLKDC